MESIKLKFISLVERLQLKNPVTDIMIALGRKSKGNISEYLNLENKKEPSRTFLIEFCEKFDYDFHGLFSKYFNESEVENLNDFKTNNQLNVKVVHTDSALTIGKQVITPKNADQFDDWYGVPMYDVPVSASFVSLYRDESAYHPQFYLKDPRFKDCNFGAIITGDSMHGEIRHSDRVICKELNNKRSIIHGDIYYIVTEELETCKYIHPVVKDVRIGAVRRKDGSYSHNDLIYDHEKFLLVPHNGSIPPSEIYKEDIIKLYKVKGVLRGY